MTAAMTRRQRIAVASDLMGTVEILDCDTAEVAALLAEYAVAVDLGCDPAMLHEMHGELDEAVADALTAATLREDVDALLAVRDVAGLLWDSVPVTGGGALAVAWRLAVRQASVMVWAERIARLPAGRVRDAAAMVLEAVHVAVGGHNGGPECEAVVAAYSPTD